MRVAIESGNITLNDPGKFDAFDVSAPGLSSADVLVALGLDGRPNDQPDHVFVSVPAVRRWAGDVDATWEADFQAMLAYAGSKGWLDGSGEFIAAHIVQPER